MTLNFFYDFVLGRFVDYVMKFWEKISSRFFLQYRLLNVHNNIKN
jgi:hypothetical protein